MHTEARNSSYLNRILTVIACLLGALLVQQSIGLPDVPSASAAAEKEEGTPPALNAAEQRRRILEAIQGTNERLERLENTLQRGIDVTVTKMPEPEAKE